MSTRRTSSGRRVGSGGRWAFAITAALVAPLAAGCIVAANPAAEASFEAQVPGRYVAVVDGQTAEMRLEPDGTGSLNGQTGQWTITMGQLMLSDGQQWVPATLEGGVLTVQTPEGAVAFTRQDDGGAPGAAPGVAPSADLAAAGPAAAADPASAPAAAAPGGDVNPRLVGCWEDYSRSDGGSGSGSYQSTLRLAADGRYERRTFTSISAGELSSVDDRREAGRWSGGADGVLTLTSDAGETATTAVSFEGGVLFLGRARHLPCS